MIDIYKAWVDLGIDGFRIDTVKHVNMEFWQKFSPAVLDHARERGQRGLLHVRRGLRRQPGVHEHLTPRPASCRPPWTSASRTRRSSSSQGKTATQLRDLFAGDDYYTDTDSNAYELPTFLGNHDMGRLPAPAAARPTTS